MAGETLRRYSGERINTETLEPYKDQWAYLSTLGRMSPREVRRAADKAGKVTVAAEATRLRAPGSTEIRQQAPEVLHARLGAGIRVEQAELTPGLVPAVRRDALGRGGSIWMHERRPGDRLRVRGPLDEFSPSPEHRPSVLLAGGIGITPILGLARAACTTGTDYRVIYSGRTLPSMPTALRRHPGHRRTRHLGQHRRRADR